MTTWLPPFAVLACRPPPTYNVIVVSFGAMAEQVPDPVGESVIPAPDANAVYQAISARRISYDQMMWQVPALSLTAQSFLVAIAVNTGLGSGVRVLALFLAMVSGALAMQLMAKQRFMNRSTRCTSASGRHPRGRCSSQVLHRMITRYRAGRAKPQRWVSRPAVGYAFHPTDVGCGAFGYS